ncbi:X-ray repair cross-complementing protein 5-like isoform X1 [Biomphalaria glabrata]|uniref:DNA helicase n=1 Tax=Biomphalaria glabrata TaxID=6526 RepID=A0A9W3BJG2_BIOGL|nr:X-ray repair cross-complementing protein 5-like isoform X1 [Biomphalaria glabrata]XP_055899568.1 X-ray repair cross-complementing protein 5-like isoform X1 [Biomphalaria glabrata]XP_055899570.1 X-ray repair cross-complementing protein 5-like isoform X1 [Biomphalaria glabrata]XP_055899571.1 X-ray repair cross-complementing protein 5-like isoform X1 [Biomphalaria glabrata]XP_055899572.1 X-ray repair cross-complementing protein 5-like isoform X1 [Biomphalaria glabrata]
MADFGYARYGDEDENEEDEEGEVGSSSRLNQRDGLIFLIDASESMFDDLFQLSLKAVKSTMQNKIISSERDLIGTVFFGTEKKDNPHDFNHIYIYQSLEQPGAQRILDLEELENNGISTFDKDFGHSRNYSLGDAFWTCLEMFSKADSNKTMGSKRILLFTNTDDPHSGNTKLKNFAETKAFDLSSNNIVLELMHLKKSGETFDFNIFYKKLLYINDDELTELPDPSDKIEELLQRVRAKDHKKRALRRIPLSLGEGLNISVGVYNLVRHCPKPTSIKLNKKDNAELVTHTKTYLQETGEVLMPQDLKKSQTYGGRKICFENDEVAEMKKFGEPGLYLMGFKPTACLKKYFFVKPGQFIYPDENKTAGSTTLFTALLQKCLDRDVTPICKYIPGNNFPPRFVTLLPQKEEIDEHKVQVTPPGFHVIFLPFADDFRKLNYDAKPKATKEQIDKAKEVIKKLNFKFSSDNFENPVLQKHWRNIEALALKRVDLEEFVDHTMPPTEALMKRAGKVLEEFKDLVFPSDYYQKTKASSSAAKKAKTEDALIDIDIKEEARAGRLTKLTVPILKEIIKKHKIATTATRKNDLIDAIVQHFGV